ncbi:MAG TPA: hypothetical protein VE713_02205 [Pyrinomonadaceae bacterium]|jgi:hypothetical protein|nr:hypothetical protein [Pyrinomonadaceae bacterium]
MSDNIEGKAVGIAGASGRPGEAGDRPDWLSCLALNHQPARKQR